ncbi:MAG: hypothetical protein ACYC9S_05630 [Leptospirales bacterium]
MDHVPVSPGMMCADPNGRFGTLLFQDSYTIPCVMAPIQGQVLSVSRILMLITIPVSILFLWGKMREQQSIFGDLLRILGVFILLVGYDTFFQDLTLLVGAIANALYPGRLILLFYESLWNAPLIPVSSGSFFSVLSDPMGLVYILLMDFLKVLIFLFTLLRYALLAFLYVIGPLLCAMAVIPGMFFMVVQWGRNALEIMLWIVVHNLLIGIFTAVNLVGALNPGGFQTVFENQTLSLGIMLILVLMFLIVPVLTHLLLDRSYEGVGSFVGPQAILLGKRLFSEGLLRPATTGELPFGLGEFKVGSVTKDLGQGKRVYRKKQLRIGPYSVTSLLWKRKPKEEGKTVRKSRSAPVSGESADTPSSSRTTRTRKSPARKTVSPRTSSESGVQTRKRTRKTASPEEPDHTGTPAKSARTRKTKTPTPTTEEIP